MQAKEERVNSQELTMGIVKLFNIYAKTKYNQNKIKNNYQLWETIIEQNRQLFIMFLKEVEDIPQFRNQRTRFQQEIIQRKHEWIIDLEKGKKLYKLRDTLRDERHKNVDPKNYRK